MSIRFSFLSFFCFDWQNRFLLTMITCVTSMPLDAVVLSGALGVFLTTLIDAMSYDHHEMVPKLHFMNMKVDEPS